RIDCVPKAFKDRYPALRVQAWLLGTPFEQLTHKPSRENERAAIRRDWLELMNTLERDSNPYVVFGRLDPNLGLRWPGFDNNERCLLTRQGDQVVPNEQLSRRFKKMLDSTIG